MFVLFPRPPHFFLSAGVHIFSAHITSILGSTGVDLSPACFQQSLQSSYLVSLSKQQGLQSSQCHANTHRQLLCTCMYMYIHHLLQLTELTFSVTLYRSVTHIMVIKQLLIVMKAANLPSLKSPNNSSSSCHLTEQHRIPIDLHVHVCLYSY